MKRLMTAMMLAALALAVCGQVTPETIVKEEDSVLEALRKNDAQTLLNKISPYFTYLSWRGTMKRTRVLEIASTSVLGRHAMTDPKVRMLDNAALLTYSFERPSGEDSGPMVTVWASSLWVNFGDNWQMVMHQESRVPVQTYPAAPSLFDFDRDLPDPLAQTFLKADRSLLTSFEKKDAAQIEKILPADFVGLGGQGRYERNKMVQIARTGGLNEFIIDRTDMRMYDNKVALLMYRLRSSAHGKPLPVRWVSTIFQRDGKVWKPVFRQESVDETRPITENYITTPSGLKYYDLESKAGETPKKGQIVSVNYTGWLLDGRKFDSSLDRGRPFEFPLGEGRVIKGWDEGVATMTVGTKRRLVIPANLAYGDRATGMIPPGATLLFEVELLSIRDQTPPAPAGGTPNPTPPKAGGGG